MITKFIFCTLFLFSFASANPMPVSMEAIQESVKGAIDKVMQISNDYEITLSTKSLKLEQQDAGDEIEVKDLSFDPGTYHFHGLLNTKAGAGKTPDLQIRGNINLIVDVPVVTRLIHPNEEIFAADIAWQKMPLAKVNQDIVQNKDDLIGKVVKGNSLKPGMTIRKSSLQALVMIKKKDTVTIVYKDEGLSLSTVGEAQQDGAHGDLIRITLFTSKKDIQARVKAKGQAEIQAVG